MVPQHGLGFNLVWRGVPLRSERGERETERERERGMYIRFDRNHAIVLKG